MPIVLIRIDDRLIHGQITVAWSRISNPDIIAVVSDKVASDDIQRSALELGAPLGIGVAIFSISESLKELNPESPRGKKKVFIIVPNPEDALKLVDGGLVAKSINVGQMGFKKGKKQIARTLFVDESDIKAFRKLRSRGITLEHRQLPSNKKIDIETLLPETRK